MKYSVEMGSGAMIYIPSFIKIDSGIENLVWGGRDSQKHSIKSHKPTLGKKAKDTSRLM
jgi:hypothetical protein